MEPASWGDLRRFVRLRGSISLPGGEGWAGKRGAGQEGWTPHRWGWQSLCQLGPAPPPPAKGNHQPKTTQPVPHMAGFPHCCGIITDIMSKEKNNFKSCDKLIKGHYWKSKPESGTFFRDRFQQYCSVASISFLSLDLRLYIKSSCQAKQLFVTPGKWLFSLYVLLYVFIYVFICTFPAFQSKTSVAWWHKCCAGAYIPGRTHWEKFTFPQGK